MSIETPDWSTIPAPLDDGATRHLIGMPVASIPLPHDVPWKKQLYG